jgi:hypothetical protein
MEKGEQIAMVRAHIEEGERHVTRQHEIIERLHELGAETAVAEDLLGVFEGTLAEHRRHLDRLLGG